MSLLAWLRNRTSLRSWRRDGSQIRPTSPRFRPQLEALEDRWLPSTLTVTNNLDSGPGSLRAEIAASHNKDTIVFAPSLDGRTITLTSGSLIISQKNLSIQGPGSGQLTVSGNYASTVFLVQGTNVKLSGLTISNGLGNAGTPYYVNDRYGGGIANYGTLTVSGCTLSNNDAIDGGGIYNAGTLTVTGSTLSGNYANYGAAIYNNGTATVSGCTLNQNVTTGTSGLGVIYNATYNPAMLTVSNTTFDNNLGVGGIFGGYTNGGGNIGVY